MRTTSRPDIASEPKTREKTREPKTSEPKA
jgi:hypothetical protein